MSDEPELHTVIEQFFHNMVGVSTTGAAQLASHLTTELEDKFWCRPNIGDKLWIGADDTGDPQLNTMSVCVNALKLLTVDEQRATVWYLKERFGKQ